MRKWTVASASLPVLRWVCVILFGLLRFAERYILRRLHGFDVYNVRRVPIPCTTTQLTFRSDNTLLHLSLRRQPQQV
jgi:hypothetical protein